MTDPTRKVRMPGTLPIGWKAVLIVLPLVTALVALSIGRYAIPIRDVAGSIFGHLRGVEVLASKDALVLWNIRMPRILLALLAGAGLSLSGLAFQSLFANPLATPDTLGVASGSSFGAALGLLLGFRWIGVQLFAVAMGLLAVCLTFLAGSGRGRGLNTLVLAGIMIGSLFSALVSFVKFVADTESQLPAITYWLMGSLDAAGYRSLLYGAPPILVGIIVLALLRWRLNVLPLSDDEAASSGVRIRTLRTITILTATMMTASCVAMCGQVGWVGLLIPHICRMKFGNNHLSLVPASVSLGAVFLVVVDTLARTITAQEIPISVLTAIIGAPFFILLMRRSGGWQL